MTARIRVVPVSWLAVVFVLGWALGWSAAVVMLPDIRAEWRWAQRGKP